MRLARRMLMPFLLLALPAAAQTAWFPPEFEQGATRQLSDRLVEVGVAEGKTEEERLEWSGRFVDHVVARVDAWGLRGVLARALDLAEVDFPPTEDEILSAIVSYGACSLPLHPELVETREEKVFVAMGEIAVVIVSAFLRHQSLAAGRSDEEMAAYLASEAMNQLSYDVQVEEGLRNYVVAQCGPMFEAILG